MLTWPACHRRGMAPNSTLTILLTYVYTLLSARRPERYYVMETSVLIDHGTQDRLCRHGSSHARGNPIHNRDDNHDTTAPIHGRQHPTRPMFLGCLHVAHLRERCVLLPLHRLRPRPTRVLSRDFKPGPPGLRFIQGAAERPRNHGEAVYRPMATRF